MCTTVITCVRPFRYAWAQCAFPRGENSIHLGLDLFLRGGEKPEGGIHSIRAGIADRQG